MLGTLVQIVTIWVGVTFGLTAAWIDAEHAPHPRELGH
jgi:hypothetical protein